MKLGSALAFVALVALPPTVPAWAAKDDKLPRCTGKHKRPANLYGTVLPTIPDRGLTPTAPTGAGGVPRGTPVPQGTAPTTPGGPASSPTTNLFPPPSAAPTQQGPTSSLGRVPAIGTLDASPRASAILPTSYASC
jgi:hypothetical protein